MQFHLLRALEQKLGSARRIAPVDVPEKRGAKWFSRVCKKFRIPRPYTYYSDRRLKEYADKVEAQLPNDSNGPTVFFGALPFVKCRPAQPYFIYTDSAFFIHYWEYNQDHTHAPCEIERICRAEADFMHRAAGVLCTSQWVADRIVQKYEIPAEKVYFVGTGPSDVPPPVNPIRYENFLVMIAADFERKQGRLTVEGVTEARRRGLNLGIKLIGAKPPSDVLGLSYVEWCGWLDLKREEDRNRFANVMSQAAAHILLSRIDLTPLAILESATYSKATLAANVGGIPEMITHGQTGWLINANANYKAVAERLISIFRYGDSIIQCGKAASFLQKTNWNWSAVVRRAAFQTISR